MNNQEPQRIVVVLALCATVLACNCWSAAVEPSNPDNYFLSATNPVATVDQRDIETRAMRIMDTPEVQAARKIASYNMKRAVGQDPTPEQWATFDTAMTEYSFNKVTEAVNSDANYPKVLQMFMPPHEWFGTKIGGSRIGGDNADNCYRMIPLDGSARYEVTIRRSKPGPTNETFTLTGNSYFTTTFSNVELGELVANADGTFTLTIDPTPANGRPNHLQSNPNVRNMQIRDVRSDWRQIPNTLMVRRLDPPGGPPLNDAQIAKQAADFMTDIPLNYWLIRLFSGLAPNIQTDPSGSGSLGGLATQVSSQGRAKLADDEALVVTVKSAGAAYLSFMVYDCWLRSVDYAYHTSSLNNSQAVPNSDGSYTYVVSVKDPGVHNWIDTVGLHDVLLHLRWQLLPRDRTMSGDPAIVRRKLVKFKDLDKELPTETKRVTPAERKWQLAERLASYQIRLTDH